MPGGEGGASPTTAGTRCRCALAPGEGPGEARPARTPACSLLHPDTSGTGEAFGSTHRRSYEAQWLFSRHCALNASFKSFP